AEAYGEALPSFGSLSEATAYYFALRDEHLSILVNISEKQDFFKLDYSVESLKKIEAWYFDFVEHHNFEIHGVDRATFERCMFMYFGEVVIKNNKDAEWIVEEYVFSQGKYELGIRKDPCSYMATRFVDLYREPNNKRKQYIYRTYKKNFA